MLYGNETLPPLMKSYLFIFDMGGVVTRGFLVWEGICRAMGVADAKEAEKKHGGLIDAACRGDISSMESLELLARREGCAAPKENYWLTFFKPTLIEETVALVHDLQAKGQRVVCGTNTLDVHYQYHMEHKEYAAFDAVYASHLMRQIKPDITFWHYIRDAEKSWDFEDIFFFDDNEQNVAAAQSLGIHAHLFTGAEDARAFIERLTGESI